MSWALEAMIAHLDSSACSPPNSTYTSDPHSNNTYNICTSNICNTHNTYTINTYNT